MQIFKDNELQVQHLKGKLKLISATTAPVNLGQTDWSDDESDDELKIEKTDPENVYPNTFFLPPSGVQRGSTLHGNGGDPLSPGWTSIKGAYRLEINETY